MDDNQTPGTARHHRDEMAPWIFGAILIVIGVFMLLQNLTGLHWGNWWALFILIPAGGSLASAWRLYQVHGTIDAAVRGPLVGGVILFFVFAMFFFGFNWSLFWPVLLILAGIGALVGVFARD